jgi:hypothetical protein
LKPGIKTFVSEFTGAEWIPAAISIEFYTRDGRLIFQDSKVGEIYEDDYKKIKEENLVESNATLDTFNAEVSIPEN